RRSDHNNRDADSDHLPNLHTCSPGRNPIGTAADGLPNGGALSFGFAVRTATKRHKNSKRYSELPALVVFLRLFVACSGFVVQSPPWQRKGGRARILRTPGYGEVFPDLLLAALCSATYATNHSISLFHAVEHFDIHFCAD